MVNIITSKSRNRWRVNANSKYHGATSEEVIQRAQEVASKPGATPREIHNAVREMTMHDSPKKAWEHFQAGVQAGEQVIEDKIRSVVADVEE